ncbi:Lecithin:cholesterol acyltransferase family protein [Trichomonas vaginalis G3]|uniref:Lecithin:cholesterol acyltransferase family protein n=1 Tax=Trichomonas vaginalis (strain ATCC PRA-98 / G3) TaxID=412133 RepID=A2EJC7_TRIV3|nr:O-acyltransferase protein [Trichomonas vaginalis G3]EAY07279.1 Lecithin:cholesterol acyltransferase family protein [Trichomonas vaginalis G3]KAI5511949.1 O-acyltransferase protein [Trichomonas vaginalis G3]|eukprot:XP_001319502.1 Lecithin:cholesterol acyltransferase family protein [Trichomonas vaginalis G3]
MKDELIWVDATMFISKRKDCLCKLLTPRLDSDGKIRNYKNISIYVKDFGGDESVRYAANAKIFNYSFVESMAGIIDILKGQGYTLKKDLFVAPYDWRISPAFSEDFHQDLKILIENASKINNQKVTLFGFSLGGFNSQQFLSKRVNQAWKDQFIEQLILLAPSFVGTTSNLLYFWTRSSPLVPFYHAPELKELVEGWPCIHSHNPNLIVFGNRTVVIGPDGTNYTSEKVFEFASKFNLIRPKYFEMYKKSYEITKSYPEEPHVKTTLLFNSGLDTTEILDFKKGWDKYPHEIFTPGDTRIPAHGMEWVCKNWSNIKCFDFNRHNKQFEHQALINNPRVVDYVCNITNHLDLIPQEPEISL